MAGIFNIDEVGPFDLYRWKPCTPEQYVTLVGQIGQYHPDNTPVASQVGDLPDDRVRVVTFADVVPMSHGGDSGIQPYLLLMYDPETERSTAFRRTDVKLNTAE